MIQPIITFRQNVSPYNVLSNPYIYSETVAKQSSLPVDEGDDSDTMYFRIYNNYGQATGVATAMNVTLQTYDSSTILTSSTLAVSHMWVKMRQNGYGENSIPPGQFTMYIDLTDTAIGLNSVYLPTYGSNGNSTSSIRAGSDSNSVGFVEVATKASVPLTDNAGKNTYQFGIVVQYEWSP